MLCLAAVCVLGVATAAHAKTAIHITTSSGGGSGSFRDTIARYNAAMRDWQERSSVGRRRPQNERAFIVL